MENIGDANAEIPVCAAIQFAKQVDAKLNKAAKQEAADATSMTRESGDDLYDGSAYHDSSIAIFTTRLVICGLCCGRTTLSSIGVIEAAACPVSGSCELEWARMYPDEYKDKTEGLAAKLLPCGAAEIECKALIGIHQTEKGTTFTVEEGACEVAIRGDNWRERGYRAIQNAACQSPEIDIPEFDGEIFPDQQSCI